jgi:hypothetical protein
MFATCRSGHAFIVTECSQCHGLGEGHCRMCAGKGAVERCQRCNYVGPASDSAAALWRQRGGHARTDHKGMS